MKQFRLDGKNVVLTGAAGFLGSFYSKFLYEAGAKLLLVDTNYEKCCELVEGMEDSFAVKCDISNELEVEYFVKTMINIAGKIDVLINNAAAKQTTIVKGKNVGFENFPLELWQQNLDVNLTGAFLCCREFGKHMVETGGGVILNIGSKYGVVGCDQRVYGDSGINSSVAYAVTKSGIIGLTKYLAAYWQGKNIRVNCLSPGGVYNYQDKEFVENYLDKTMLKRMATEEDIANALLYLVSDASAWVTGFNMIVDGGWTAW